ncbi:MAG: cell division protein FtsZ [Fibrobacteraceae bacterium]|nr:cell division protein FtsZ [Fibrobacteraceae bacterium]
MNQETNILAAGEEPEARHIIASDSESHKAKIKIVGVGGAGGNAVNRMVKMNIKDVEFISINTDALALERSLADDKIAIGLKTTKTLGAGAKPEIGRKAILEDKDSVLKKLEGADMVFIAAGMGGGTGTGAAPVVAEIARKLGILTVAVVTMPFKWEGPVRRRNAESGLATLRSTVDSIIVINNQRLLDIIEKATSMDQAFLKVDEVLGNAVRSICDIMFIHGTINVDFNDARTVMADGGAALMGTGIAAGEDRALHAAELAITCPLLDDIKVSGASGVLINVAHGENFGMMEYSAAMDYLYQEIGTSNNPNIVAGDVTIPELGDQVSVTVIATGFDKRPEENLEKLVSPAMGQAPAAPTETASEAPKQETRRTRIVEQATPRPTANFKAWSEAPDYATIKMETPYSNNSIQIKTPPASQPSATPNYAQPMSQAYAQSQAPMTRPSAMPNYAQPMSQAYAQPPAQTMQTPTMGFKAKEDAPVFKSFQDSTLNVRSMPREEEEVVPPGMTIRMSKPATPTISTPAAAQISQNVQTPAEELSLDPKNDYGTPSFLRNNKLSEEDF